MRKTVVVLGCSLSLLCHAQAGRPLVIDDADTAGPGVVEVEAGLTSQEDGSTKQMELPVGIAYGVGSTVEFGAGFGGQWLKEASDEEEDFTDLSLSTKWTGYRSDTCGLRAALAPSIKLPVADEDKDMGSGEVDYDLTGICSLPLGQRCGLHANAGFTWTGDHGEGDMVHYGLALDCAVSERLQWVGEVFAEDECGAHEDTLGSWSSGIRFGVSDSLVLDIAGGAPWSGEGSDYIVTMGLTYVFQTSKTSSP